MALTPFYEEADKAVYRVKHAGADPWVLRLFPAARPLERVEGDAAVLRCLEEHGVSADVKGNVARPQIREMLRQIRGARSQVRMSAAGSPVGCRQRRSIPYTAHAFSGSPVSPSKEPVGTVALRASGQSAISIQAWPQSRWISNRACSAAALNSGQTVVVWNRKEYCPSRTNAEVRRPYTNAIKRVLPSGQSRTADTGSSLTSLLFVLVFDQPSHNAT